MMPIQRIVETIPADDPRCPLCGQPLEKGPRGRYFCNNPKCLLIELQGRKYKSHKEIIVKKIILAAQRKRKKRR